MSLIFLRKTRLMNPRTLCNCHPVACAISARVAPPVRRNSSSIVSLFVAGRAFSGDFPDCAGSADLNAFPFFLTLPVAFLAGVTVFFANSEMASRTVVALCGLNSKSIYGQPSAWERHIQTEITDLD